MERIKKYWIVDCANGSAKFWLQVVTELKTGSNDILIACVDGLKGFPEEIESVFHKRRSVVHRCIW